MVLTADERRYVDSARIARLATADDRGRPQAVPVCFALWNRAIVSPIDDKPARVEPSTLRRVRDIEANPYVTLLVDHYTEDWDSLGWVQIRGRASILRPTDTDHDGAIRVLRTKYDQYADHGLESRPIIRVDPGHAVSWGRLER